MTEELHTNLHCTLLGPQSKFSIAVIRIKTYCAWFGHCENQVKQLACEINKKGICHTVGNSPWEQGSTNGVFNIIVRNLLCRQELSKLWPTSPEKKKLCQPDAEVASLQEDEMVQLRITEISEFGIVLWKWSYRMMVPFPIICKPTWLQHDMVNSKACMWSQGITV